MEGSLAMVISLGQGNSTSGFDWYKRIEEWTVPQGEVVYCLSRCTGAGIHVPGLPLS